MKSSISKHKRDLSRVTNDVIDTLADAVLFVTFNMLTTTGTRTMKQADYGMYQADLLLCRYNSQTIRKALHNLVSKRYIKRKNVETEFELSITREGLTRIHELIPTYKEKRSWDGYLYLISYDIPVKSNTKRNLLRQYLRHIGCGKLQDSLWMTPYNPTGIVDIFVDEEHVPGTILVSKLGKDGTIGNESRKTLIAKVYGYRELQIHYEEFIEKYSDPKSVSKTQLAIDYYTILKNDPQLPFALEPDNFPSRTANRIFRSLLSR